MPSAGVVLEVASGGTAANTTLTSGAMLEVLSGGLADPTIVSSGTTESVSAGGTDSGAQISGGTQFVYGVANAAIVFAGAQIVELGGLASGTTVSSGGTLDVLSGGTAIAPQLLAGATLTLDGTLSGFIVSSGISWRYRAPPPSTIPC